MSLSTKFFTIAKLILGSRRNRVVFFFVFVASMFSSNAFATDVRFTGGSYSFSDGQVTMTINNIEDYTAYPLTSGSLRIQMWAFASPYAGTGASGYEIADSQNFGPIGFGATIDDTETVNYNLPPDGTYYITLFLLEYTGTGSIDDGFQIDDSFNISNPLTVGVPTQSHPTFFNGEEALTGGVYYLTFFSGNYFGYYSYLTDPAYIYHFDLGYEYVFDANDGYSGVYLYDFASDTFFYTSPIFPFPYLYDFTLNTVLYYYSDTTNPGHYTANPRYFYNYATGKIITK